MTYQPRRRGHHVGFASPARTALVLLSTVACVACADSLGHGGPESDPQPGELLIPSSDDWVDRGVIFSQGDPGSWDAHLWGGFTVTAVRREGALLLYYQGADGFDDAEGTVTFRSVGLATSRDGITFEKHADNPVLRWTPNDDLEEGVGSAGALIMPNGRVGIVYGALTHAGGVSVTADARLATSAEGVSFEDLGIALHHGDDALWGAGDEVFPVIALEHDGRWIVYYIPNGTPERARLGVAFGPDPMELASSWEVLASGSSVPAWGPAAAVRLGPERYALFVNADADAHADGPHIDAYVMDPSEPQVLEGPRSVLAFSNLSRGTVVFDDDTDTWFLFHRSSDATEYLVRTATALREPG